MTERELIEQIDSLTEKLNSTQKRNAMLETALTEALAHMEEQTKILATTHYLTARLQSLISGHNVSQKAA